MKASILLRILGAVALFATFSSVMWSADPTITWNQSLVSSFYPAAGWYQGPQAVAHDNDGDLESVSVWCDGVPHAIDGSGTGYDNSSDPNWAYHASGFHVFSAQAVDHAGHKSPIIYWPVKIGGAFNSISFFDLPNPSSGIHTFLNTGSGLKNAELMNSVILSLTGDYTSGKILEFAPEEYDFQTSQLFAFNNVGHLIIRSPSTGTTTLKWGDSSNAASLFETDRYCTNMSFEHLSFDTFYTSRQVDGSHIKITGSSNINIEYCAFTKAPGFAIYVQPKRKRYDDPSDPDGLIQTPYNIHIDGNTIVHNFSDGIHVAKCDTIYIVGNVVSYTGDDGIALIDDAKIDEFTTDFHILSNQVWNNGWRGIVVMSAGGTSTAVSEIHENNVDYTAWNGISLEKQGSNIINYIDVVGNYVGHSGDWFPHGSTNEGDKVDVADGFYLNGCANIYAVDNQVYNPLRYGAYIVSNCDGLSITMGKKSDFYTPGGDQIHDETTVATIQY